MSKHTNESKAWMTHATSRDLPGFERDAKKLILEAVALGAQLRVSHKGHAILRGPGGQTVSVPRSLRNGNRGAQNSRAGVKRLFR